VLVVPAAGLASVLGDARLRSYQNDIDIVTGSAMAVSGIASGGKALAVQDQALMQGGPQRAVNAVLQVQLTAPPDDVREQVAVERRVLGQQLLQIKRILGGDELIETDGTGRDLRPFPGSAGMIGIGPPVPDLLKDH